MTETFAATLRRWRDWVAQVPHPDDVEVALALKIDEHFKSNAIKPPGADDPGTTSDAQAMAARIVDAVRRGEERGRADAEREIVAWLRRDSHAISRWPVLAEMIERGEHKR